MSFTRPTLLSLWLAISPCACSRQPDRPEGDSPPPTLRARDPQPQPALPAVVRLFDRYTVVGLSDLHGCAEVLGFVERLVRDAAFAAKVNDITWEPGNVRYQGLMDDFILRGRDVSRRELSACWRNNTQAHTYSDTPALFELLKTIREVNQSRPEARRLRVLLIDPPVDWERIRSPEDVRPDDFDREGHMAKVLEAEVYARGRKALFFAGGAHLGRGGAGGPVTVSFDPAHPPDRKVMDVELVTPLQSLERHHPGTTFNIAVHEGFGARTRELESRLAAWPKPALALLAGTWWGRLEPASGGDVFIHRDGTPAAPGPARKLQDDWDAVLFLGRRDELTRVDAPGPDVLEESWLAELGRRQEILGGRRDGGRTEPPHDRKYFRGNE